jgi:hypothetical protein
MPQGSHWEKQQCGSSKNVILKSRISISTPRIKLVVLKHQFYKPVNLDEMARKQNKNVQTKYYQKKALRENQHLNPE